MARRGKPKTLLEVNVLLAARTFLSEEQQTSEKRLPLMDQARVMVKAIPKASRLAEFIAMWAITKNRDGAVTVESLADMWGEPVRTMYRRLEEFREAWEPVGYETPDPLADGLIADYRRRQERLTPGHVARLLSAPVAAPAGAPNWPAA
ncbi:MAG: hypothetical protein OEW52_12880 [Thermoleophilia bacterium]|nr:hypothetical protein [Thermoleophilia bacterium]MDH5282017.1 hypothetical protein [Thermoleophilia bacterium]